MEGKSEREKEGRRKREKDGKEWHCLLQLVLCAPLVPSHGTKRPCPPPAMLIVVPPSKQERIFIFLFSLFFFFSLHLHHPSTFDPSTPCCLIIYFFAIIRLLHHSIPLLSFSPSPSLHVTYTPAAFEIAASLLSLLTHAHQSARLRPSVRSCAPLRVLNPSQHPHRPHFCIIVVQFSLLFPLSRFLSPPFP